MQKHFKMTGGGGGEKYGNDTAKDFFQALLEYLYGINRNGYPV